MSRTTFRPCVVVPCLNEQHAIGELLRGILVHCRDVVVVDDASTDYTADIVAQFPVTLIRHSARRGKGEALRTGFREALNQGASGVLTMDGDGQHDPADTRRMLVAAVQHPGALVIGARLLEAWRQPIPRRRANQIADWGISWACGQPLADTQSGLRWYPSVVARLLDLPAQGFVFETAILIAACRDLGLPVVAVPIACRYHCDGRRSHFRSVHDTLQITGYTVRRILHYGRVLRSYRNAHGLPPHGHKPPPAPG